MTQAGKDALAEVNVDATFDQTNPRATAFVQNHALEDTTSYSDSMKSDITDIVSTGVSEGQSVDEMALNIGQFFDDQSDYRAMRLARTETINAYAGDLEGYKQSGVVIGKEWIGDPDACEICQGNEDDGVIALDDVFSSGDDAPTAHPNCECAIQPIVGNDMEE